jgi:hypothetical protein
MSLGEKGKTLADFKIKYLKNYRGKNFLHTTQRAYQIFLIL